MPRFVYAKPSSLDEAIKMLHEPGLVSKPLAGGTDIMVYVRQEPPWFDRLVDIAALPQLNRIDRSGDQVQIGAAVTFSKAARDPVLLEVAPLLVQACKSVGGPQIRNTGTIGGNIANAAVCADTLPPLVCLDAIVHVAGIEGDRQIPVAEFSSLPHSNVLQDGELITHFTFDIPPKSARTIFIKLGRRNAQSISRLSMAAIGRLDESGSVDLIRITPGAATPRTQRLNAVEAMLLGEKPTSELITAAAAQAATTMIEITGRRWSTEYKEVAIQALAARALRGVLAPDESTPATLPTIPQ